MKADIKFPGRISLCEEEHREKDASKEEELKQKNKEERGQQMEIVARISNE